MLSNLTNDNASLYMQEGIATYLETLNLIGNRIIIDQEKLHKKVKMFLQEVQGNIVEFNHLKKLSTSNGFQHYYQGFLYVNYLINCKGLSIVDEIARALNIYPYIDRRIEHKLDLVNERTAKAIKIIYGSPDKLTNDVREFYSKFI